MPVFLAASAGAQQPAAQLSAVPAPSAPARRQAASSKVQQEAGITVRARRRLGYSVHEASTATKTSTSLLEIPQSIQVIPRQLIEDQQSTDISDVLDNVSGVQRTGFDDTGVIPQFTVRGFALNPNTNFFRDGRPMTLSVTPPTSMLQRVEFLKGPSSALYGQAQPGGIVNMVFKRPTRHHQISSSTRLGSYYHLTQNLDAGGPVTDTLGVRLVGEYRVSDSFRDFGQSDNWLGGGMLRWQPNRQWTMDVSANRQSRHQAADSMLISGAPRNEEQSFGDRTVDVPISRSLNEPWTHIYLDTDWVNYDLKYRPRPAWEISHSASYQHQTNDELRADPSAVQQAIPSLGLEVGNTRKTQRSRRTETRTLSADLRVQWQGGADSLEHLLLAGVDYRNSVWGFREFVPVETRIQDFNVYEPVYGPPHPGLGYRLFLLARNSLNQVGGFVQDQITLWENLHLLLSLRFDAYSQDNARSRFDFGRFILEDQSGRKFSQRYGMTWDVMEDVALFASRGGGYRPNTVPFGASLVPPESSEQWEGGVKANLLDGFMNVTVSAYSLTKRNVRVENIVTGTVHSDGEHFSQGLEVDIIGDVLPGLNLLTHYSLLYAKVNQGRPSPDFNSATTVFDYTGTIKTASPRHSGKLWLAYRSSALPGLRMGGGVTARTTTQGDRENTLQHPGGVKLDAMLGYRKRLGVLKLGGQLNVHNLTDAVMFASRFRQRITPLTPRSVFATFSMQFIPSSREN